MMKTDNWKGERDWWQCSPYCNIWIGFGLSCWFSRTRKETLFEEKQYSCPENSMDGGAWWAAVHGVARSRTGLHFHFSLSCIEEGNGNPLQCSCLQNPRDGGACWAAVYGVVQSRARLKQLSSSSVFFYYMELQSLQKYCLISNIAKKSLNIHHQLYKIRRGF